MAEPSTASAKVADEYGNEATSSLWIKYVPIHIDGTTIRDHFMRWGQVESVAPEGRARARSGWAIINYYTVEDASRAYRSENNRVILDGDHACIIKFTPPRDVARPHARPKLDAAAQTARDEWFGSSSQSTGTTAEERAESRYDFIRPRPAAPKSMRRQVSPPPIRRFGDVGVPRMYQADTWRPDDEDETRLDRASHLWRPYEGFRNKTWVRPAGEPAKEEGIAPKSISSLKSATIKSPIHSAKARATELVNYLPCPAPLAQQQLPSLSNDDIVRQSIIAPSPEPSPPLQPYSDDEAVEVSLTHHALSSSLLVPRHKTINDETTSINSSSTHTSVRRRACADCKDIETSISLFTKCAGCTRRFHQTCGNPPPSATETGNFRCGKCLRKNALAVAPSSSKSSRAEVEGTTATPDPGQVNIDIETHDHHLDSIDDTDMIDDPLRDPMRTPRMLEAADMRQTSEPTNAFRVEESQSTKGWPTVENERSVSRLSGIVHDHALRRTRTASGPAEDGTFESSAPAARRMSSSRTSEVIKEQIFDRFESRAISNREGLSDTSGQFPWEPTFATADGVVRTPKLVLTRKHEPDLHLSAKDIARRYKDLACRWWRLGDCRLTADDCHYAHRHTGKDVPRNGNTAKHFTCFYWAQSGYCVDGNYCRFAHEDTGIYVTEHGDPSLKHVTCSFWRLSRCNRNASDCGFAHEDTGVYINQRKESELLKSRSSQHAAAPKRWPSIVMQAPQADRDFRHSTCDLTGQHSQSIVLGSSTRGGINTHRVLDPREIEGIGEHRKPSRDAAHASNAESRPASETTIACAADVDEARFTATKSDHTPTSCQQTSSIADAPSQTETLESSEPVSSKLESKDTAKAPYASFGNSLELSTDDRSKARFLAPEADTAMSPLQHELRRHLVYGIDTPHSPGIASDISDATAPYSKPGTVTNSSVCNRGMDLATSSAKSQVGRVPEPGCRENLVSGSAQLKTLPIQTAHGSSSNSVERRTAAGAVTASSEPPKHLVERSGRDPREERMEILKQQHLANKAHAQPVTALSQPVLVTPTVNTCETCSKKIFSGSLCQACQRVNIIANPQPKQPMNTDEAPDADYMSFMTELLPVESGLDPQLLKPTVTKHVNDNSDQSISLACSKFNGVTNSMKRSAETSPFITKKRAKVESWPPRPVMRQNVEESPEVTIARRSLERLKEQEALRTVSLRAATPQILGQDTDTRDGTDSNKENRQPSTVPSQGISTEASSVRSSANHSRQAPQEGYTADPTVSTALHQEQLAAQAWSTVEKTPAVPLARPQPSVGINPASSEAPTCNQCRHSHKKCFHAHDGVAYDATKCKTYLESHPKASCLTLAISNYTFQQIVRSAKTVGLFPSSAESDYDVEDDGDEEKGYLLPPPVSHEPIQPDDDNSSDDARPIYQSKKRKSQMLSDEVRLPTLTHSNNNTVISVESSLQTLPVDPRRTDAQVATKITRQHDRTAPSSMAKPQRLVWDKSINLQTAIAKLKARGVEFESDSDTEGEEHPIVSTRKNVTPVPSGSSRDLFDIAPSLRPRTTDVGRASGLLSAREVGHISKKDIWKTLLARQCRERKLKFGDPHQEVRRDIGSRSVSALITRDAPADRARGKLDRFHVPAKEEKVITTTFENFLGIPKEPVVCREWSGEGFKMWFELAYRDGKKGSADARFSRRNVGNEKYVFTKS